MEGFEIEDNVDVETQEILLAASSHDIEKLKALLRTGSANVQDAETGFTPLHAAIAACEEHTEVHGTSDKAAQPINGHSDKSAIDLEAAEKTVRLLFENGAIWNDLDARGETPGDTAWRLNLKDIYNLIVDAGVRAELLLNRLDDYEALDGNDDDDDDDVDDDNEVETELEATTLPPNPTSETEPTDVSLHNTAYLTRPLAMRANAILDASSNAVMMSWETSIMQRSSSALLPSPNLRLLNVGFGMGIFDTLSAAAAAHAPRAHHIIEAHPDILPRARRFAASHGNVTLHEGRWQEVLPRLAAAGVEFDGIFFDTFAEDYRAFRAFFSEWVVALLAQGGRWSFFHGLGADRRVCYDVYTKVVEMDLFEAGFDVEWEVRDTGEMFEENGEEWDGVRRRYWAVEEYRLPLCTFIA